MVRYYPFLLVIFLSVAIHAVAAQSSLCTNVTAFQIVDISPRSALNGGVRSDIKITVCNIKESSSSKTRILLANQPCNITQINMDADFIMCTTSSGAPTKLGDTYVSQDTPQGLFTSRILDSFSFVAPKLLRVTPSSGPNNRQIPVRIDIQYGYGLDYTTPDGQRNDRLTFIIAAAGDIRLKATVLEWREAYAIVRLPSLSSVSGLDLAAELWLDYDSETARRRISYSPASYTAVDPSAAAAVISFASPVAMLAKPNQGATTDSRVLTLYGVGLHKATRITFTDLVCEIIQAGADRVSCRMPICETETCQTKDNLVIMIDENAEPYTFPYTLSPASSYTNVKPFTSFPIDTAYPPELTVTVQKPEHLRLIPYINGKPHHHFHCNDFKTETYDIYLTVPRCVHPSVGLTPEAQCVAPHTSAITLRDDDVAVVIGPTTTLYYPTNPTDLPEANVYVTLPDFTFSEPTGGPQIEKMPKKGSFFDAITIAGKYFKAFGIDRDVTLTPFTSTHTSPITLRATVTETAVVFTHDLCRDHLRGKASAPRCQDLNGKYNVTLLNVEDQPLEVTLTTQLEINTKPAASITFHFNDTYESASADGKYVSRLVNAIQDQPEFDVNSVAGQLEKGFQKTEAGDVVSADVRIFLYPTLADTKDNNPMSRAAVLVKEIRDEQSALRTQFATLMGGDDAIQVQRCSNGDYNTECIDDKEKDGNDIMLYIYIGIGAGAVLLIGLVACCFWRRKRDREARQGLLDSDAINES